MDMRAGQGRSLREAGEVDQEIVGRAGNHAGSVAGDGHRELHRSAGGGVSVGDRGDFVGRQQNRRELLRRSGRTDWSASRRRKSRTREPGRAKQHASCSLLQSKGQRCVQWLDQSSTTAFTGATAHASYCLRKCLREVNGENRRRESGSRESRSPESRVQSPESKSPRVQGRESRSRESPRSRVQESRVENQLKTGRIDFKNRMVSY